MYVNGGLLTNREQKYLPLYLSAFFILDSDSKAKNIANEITQTSEHHGNAIVTNRVDFDRHLFVNQDGLNSNQGFLYIINQDDTDFYKIGITKYTVSDRLNQLQIGNPSKLNCLFCSRFHFYRELERILHITLYDKNIRSEWFEISESDINVLLKLLNYLPTKIV